MSNDHRDLEILVAKIQEQLAPDAEVVHDAKLKGGQSKRSRQIDVLVRQKIGQYEMLIVLECKDYARPVDVKGVGQFYELMTDVGAHKGALVCPKGFTEAAKERASGWQIDLYSPVDTDAHKWQVRVTAPVVCDFRSAALSFCISSSAPKPFRLPCDFWSSVVALSEAGTALGTPSEAAIKKWNDGIYPDEPGEHRDLPIFETVQVLIDNGYGDLIPVNLTVSLFVERQLYYGQLPITRISGFSDELSGGVITNAFTTGIFDPDEVTRSWLPIGLEAELPVRPLFGLGGRVCWSDQA